MIRYSLKHFQMYSVLYTKQVLHIFFILSK